MPWRSWTRSPSRPRARSSGGCSSSESGNGSIKADPGPGQLLIERVERIVGRRSTGWNRVLQGYTPAERWVVRFRDGSSAFVKAATNELTDRWLREEHVIYGALSPPFLPALLGWDEEPGGSLLVLEDLSSAYWPPPWTADRIDRVFETLAAVHATPPPSEVMALETRREYLSGWSRVGEDPGPFLSLGVCTEGWLAESLPELLESERRAVLAGDAFVHFDVRSDNVCFAGQRTVLVDWNWACVGNPAFDAAAWLPSLEAEGGPRPDELITGEGHLAALIAGFFASKAGLPPAEGWPGVRDLQLAQLRSALPWAARALGLEEPAPAR